MISHSKVPVFPQTRIYKAAPQFLSNSAMHIYSYNISLQAKLISIDVVYDLLKEERKKKVGVVEDCLNQALYVYAYESL